MTNTTIGGPAAASENAVQRFLRALEVDTRMLGMVGALLIIWVGFDIASGVMRPGSGGLFGGSFLTPRNLWTLLVQTAVIAVMTTGMVLVIVLRQIDLSVGSMLSVVAISTGVLQVFILGPNMGVGHPVIWIIAVVFAPILAFVWIASFELAWITASFIVLSAGSATATGGPQLSGRLR